MRGMRVRDPVNPNAPLRQAHRIAFGIVDAHLAVLQIAAFGDDHARAD